MPARWSGSCCASSTSSRTSPRGLKFTPFISSSLRQHLGSIVSAALTGVDAKSVTARAIASVRQDLAAIPRLRVVAAGKAAAGMAAAVEDACGSRLERGVLTRLRAAGATDHLGPRWDILETTHPMPSAGSEAAGRAALALADAAAADASPLLVCLSGGASAMLAVPPSGLTMDDKAATAAVLLQAGLDISEINLVRRHMSAIKGGRLGARARGSITLAISDVSRPEVDEAATIGSGPTVADRSTRRDAHAALARHDLLRRLPPRVVAHFAADEARSDEAPRPDDVGLRDSAFWIVASRQDAMRHAAETATRLGYQVDVVAAPLAGAAAGASAALLERLAMAPRPACLIASGETTVEVRGSGRGGRNQELAVGALERLAALGPAALASINTDGIDGPTDAAGAFVDDSLWGRLGSGAQSRCTDALARNDTYPLLDELHALVRTGPTGTNVGDLVVILRQ